MAEFLTIQGDRELIQRLKSLPKRVGDKVVRQALRSAAKDIQGIAKTTVPVNTGRLLRSLRVRAKKRSRTRIGFNVQLGQGFFRGPTFYGGFVEYGTKKMAARMYMARAYQISASSAQTTAMNRIVNGIEREAAAR